MAQTVGNHSVSSFTSPANGDPLDATVVTGNDNTIRSAYVDHDADPGIHLQSSTLATRPIPGISGRKWLTTDSGALKLWFDDGTQWNEITYVASPVGLTLVPSATNTYDLGNLTYMWRNIYAAGTVAADTVAAATISGSTISGSGSGLTNVPASSLTGTAASIDGGSIYNLTAGNLTGALPAISGANLTAVTASVLTGSALPSNITGSSLTSVGTLSSLNVGSTLTLQQALEKATVSATAATGTINFDALTQAIVYYTTNASGNWTLNVRGNSGTTLTSQMSNGQSLTIAFLVTQGSTAYYCSAFQIDGSSVTPKWLGATAPSSGNANGTDVYTYTIVKTAGGFIVFASRSYFA
jgi:hypothetical protein